MSKRRRKLSRERRKKASMSRARVRKKAQGRPLSVSIPVVVFRDCESDTACPSYVLG